VHRSFVQNGNRHNTPFTRSSFELEIMAPVVSYYCPCNAPTHAPPPAHLPSSAFCFHPLEELYFCEECDAVRCDECVLVEVSGYYCPNCLFEVPSASVRAEKNRSAFILRDRPSC
jgi:dynactin-4